MSHMPTQTMPTKRHVFDTPRDGVLRRAVAWACCGALTVVAAAPLRAEDGAPPVSSPASRLTVALLDLAKIPALAERAPATETHAAWRTTFGSERQTKPEVRLGADAALQSALAPLDGSDVVLIQGVKAAAPLRRLFPPRQWRLVVSRSLIARDDTFASAVKPADLPVATAIAVKASAAVRVTARAYTLDLEPEPATTDVSPSTTAGSSASATAVRVATGGHTLWLASVSLPETCADGATPCPARVGLEAWRHARRGDREATLVGGRMIGSPSAAADGGLSSACPSHGIDSDVAWRLVTPEAENNSVAGIGCISLIRIER